MLILQTLKLITKSGMLALDTQASQFIVHKTQNGNHINTFSHLKRLVIEAHAN